jgi:hypothetical protein
MEFGFKFILFYNFFFLVTILKNYLEFRIVVDINFQE